ncbi:dipeptidyl aminopeptidase-like protein 6 [Hyalella azteca]|uniref:Dipeptidyl aminopeptidase-like protein 6 n=1 Tax=Hyalella azteca TaxID=294128 RepID=A0A979FL92_HYAAZ|nr:dipeptidyl aminopeptidase-like protein 6 [Hyalella azteca]
MAEDDNFDDDELGADEPEQRNWKGIIIAVLVICSVIGMIITSVMLLTPPDTGPRIKGNRTTLKQFLDGDFNVRSFNGTWISSKSLPHLSISSKS